MPLRILNPATDALLAELQEDDAPRVAEKVARARAAQPAWSATPYAERARVVERFASRLEERLEELARVTTAEVGKPITQSRNELRGLLGRVRFFLERTPGELADEVVHVDAEGGIEERIRHEPIGVVANVSAWNYPWFVGGNVWVPALLTGNAVAYKPSEYAALTGLQVERLWAEAGVPEGAFVAVVGGGAAGAALVDAAVDAVFFTGSYATGRRVAERAASRLVRVQLELGGKDPAYICDDVDVASVAGAVADGAFYNAGQSCCAVERVYVHERVWDAFVEAFVREVRRFVVGDPTDERTYLGPLARRDAALASVEAQVADALAKGARCLTGGARVPGPGSWYQPTVLVDVTDDMAVMREESFGPVIGLARVGSDDEALARMADTDYGLTAAVYTPDAARAARLLERLDVGTAYWNCCDRVSPRLPWTGRKASGLGVTLSTYGIEAFTRPKAWHLRRT
ncbi:MAG: aldehyde dehydrogenase family protein [Polyangiaceae bacterium]|nr:aldehyde dehydrogenase family protein [Polyangiaceae bacterium]